MRADSSAWSRIRHGSVATRWTATGNFVLRSPISNWDNREAGMPPMYSLRVYDPRICWRNMRAGLRVIVSELLRETAAYITVPSPTRPSGKPYDSDLPSRLPRTSWPQRRSGISRWNMFRAATAIMAAHAVSTGGRAMAAARRSTATAEPGGRGGGLGHAPRKRQRIRRDDEVQREGRCGLSARPSLASVARATDRVRDRDHNENLDRKSTRL